MVVGVARVALHLPASSSLKDKRQIVKSLLAQVQHRFAVSAAEIEEHDRHQLGVLGLAYATTDAAHADEVIAKAVRFLDAGKHEVQLLDYQTEVMHVF